MVRGQDLKVQGAEQFGYALAADGNTIAVGSPDELIDRTGVRGAVYLYSASTLRYTRIHQRSKGVYTRWLSRFGHSVDLLDGRLVIGAPNADVGSHNGAGRVHLLRWNETKRTYSVVRSFSQATKGVPGAARDNDALGSTVVIARGLTASSSYDVVAAAMYDQLDDLKTAGSLTVTNFDKGGYRLITQDSPGVPSTPKRQGMFGWTGHSRYATTASEPAPSWLPRLNSTTPTLTAGPLSKPAPAASTLGTTCGPAQSATPISTATASPADRRDIRQHHHPAPADAFSPQWARPPPCELHDHPQRQAKHTHGCSCGGLASADPNEKTRELAQETRTHR